MRSPLLNKTGPHAVRADCAHIATDLTPSGILSTGTFAGKGLADKRLPAEPGLRKHPTPVLTALPQRHSSMTP